MPQQKQPHVVLEEEAVSDDERKISSKSSQGCVPVGQKAGSVVKEKEIEENGGIADVKESASCKMSSKGDSGKNSRVLEEMNTSWPERGTKLLDNYKVEIEKYHQKMKQLPREWEHTRYGMIHHARHRTSYSSRQPVEFSVMSYNILAQNLLDNHLYLYLGDGSRSLHWEQRRQRLVAEIAYHKPDIVNLQEVHKDHYYDYLRPILETMGYKGCYHKRTGDHLDGCATLWKDEKFKLLRFSPVEYYRGGLLDRDNIAIIVELQPVLSSHHQTHGGDSRHADDKVVVANTHLLFNPRRGDVKLAQLMILMAEIDKHAYIGPSMDVQPPFPHSTAKSVHYCPVILTGDFNMEPQSELYKFVVSGQMDYEGLLLRQISGQEEGRYGRNQLLERNFFSPMYGVTNSCQYHTAVVSRLKEFHSLRDSPSSSQSDIKDNSQDSADNYTASSSSVSTESGSHSQQLSQMSVSMGRLCHHLNLVSTYRHRIERLGREKEVTTHHNSGRCSVDYIFYSVDSKDVHFQRNGVRLRAIRDGKLKLLSRYGLMSAKELDDMGGIPNDTLASDHLCLITKFLLT